MGKDSEKEAETFGRSGVTGISSCQSQKSNAKKLEMLYLASFERNQHRETENSCARKSYMCQILKYVVIWSCHHVFVRMTLNRDICNKQYILL